MAELFMGVIVDCLRATQHDPAFIEVVKTEFASLGGSRPDLARRYARATSVQDVAEIERLLTICQRLLKGREGVWFDNLRVSSVTGRFHVGYGNRSVAVFPSIA